MLVVAIISVTLLAALAAGFLGVLGLTGSVGTLVVGALLSGAYLLVLAGVWLVARVRGVGFAEAVGLRRASAGAYVGGALLAVVAGRLAAGVWGVALEYFGVNNPGESIDPSRVFPPTPVGIAMAFLVVVVLAPLAEEVLFRGVVLSALYRRWGTAVAILGSSVLFSAMHVSPVAIVPVFVLALILGWLFVRTRSLTVCVVAHSVFNGVGLAALYALKATGVL